MNDQITLFWFRRDLRLNDNAGLFHALKNHKRVQPIFIFDTEILSKLEDRADARVAYIHKQITRLKSELEEFGVSLWVFHDSPMCVFEQILNSKSIDALYANHDYEPYARQRDKAVFELFESKKLPFRAFKDQVIFDRNEILKDNGEPYVVFTPYSKKWKEKLNEFFLKPYPTERYFQHFNQGDLVKIPTLNELGFSEANQTWSVPVLDENIVRNYHKTRDIPSIEGTSRMSLHLRFGTVSIRALAKIGFEINEKWLNELIWRDFYQSILWHFPRVETESFRKDYNRIQWLNNEVEFKAWCEGKTGYPIVDAGMRELNETGFMHNRVRMIVASFLTKHLLIDWRWGEAYFAKKLMDFDLASNNGGWQWAAGCGVDAAPYFRVFNPTLQTEKFDPEKNYLKMWVPEFETTTYPKPIVDHKMARQRAIDTYKAGLARG